MLAFRLSPPVIAFTLASMNGVASLPAIPRSVISRNASAIARSIVAAGISSAGGIGLAMLMPPARPSDHLARIMRAMSAALSRRSGARCPLFRE
jgi:hypothetical protein